MRRRASLSVLVLLSAASARAGEEPLTPARYVRAALDSSPEVKQSLEAWRGADAAYKSQLAGILLPTISFTGQDHPYGDDPSLGYAYHSWRLNRSDMTSNATIGLNVFNGFQDLLKTRAASEARDSAQRTLDAARQDRAFASIQAFYRLVSRARLREVARDDLRAQEAQYRETLDLHQHGLKSLADLYKSETEWRSSEARLVASEADYKSALQPFNELIGRPAWEERPLDDALTPGTTELPPLDADASRLAERRAEIRRSLDDAARAETAERQSLLGLLPTLSVAASWNRQDSAGASSSAGFAAPNPNRQIGVTLSLPLGYNVASQAFSYAAARAERRRAKAAVDAALRSAREELYASWIRLERATRTYALSLRLQEIAHRGLEIVEAQYRQGAADALRMAQARSDLLGAKVQTATALQDIFVNRASYRRAAGVHLW